MMTKKYAVCLPHNCYTEPRRLHMQGGAKVQTVVFMTEKLNKLFNNATAFWPYLFY
jgi:hypothetical protein